MKLLTASLLLASALVPVALAAQDLALSDTFQADALNRIERVTDARVGFTAFVPESTSGALNFDPGRTTLDRAGLRPADGPAAHDYLFPRAGQSLILGAKARALYHGRVHVKLEDIQALAAPVLRHRVLLNYRAEADGVQVDDVIQRLMEHVKF